MHRTLLVLLFSGLILLTNHLAYAQGTTITGKVTSAEDNTGLPGVNVLVEGTPSGTTTDVNGNYSINVPPQAVLTFSYIGFVSQKIAVGNQATVDVVLRPDVTQLNEVVIAGYSIVEKKDVISSIASVSSKDFKDIPVVGIDQALQGQAAGVQVTQSSGTPGGGITVRVRGSTSISASNRPLFIVDGVPIEDGSLGLRSFGGQNDNALATINPNDIESMQILKDASAKAIYGSRAANGVVLITTKRGKTDSKTTITADVQRGIIDPTKKLDLLNSDELLELQMESITNAGGKPDTLGLIPGITNGINTNWLDAIFRRAIYQQYQLSASGGSEKTRFYVSANFRDEEGVQLNNKFERYTGTVNMDHQATEKLSFGSNLILSRTKNNRVKGDNFLDGVYSGAVASLPYYSPYDEQGNLIGASDDLYPGFPNFNPVAQALLPRFETYTTKVLGGLYAEYRFIDNLRLRTKFSVDYNSVNDDQFEPSTTAIGSDPRVGGNGYGVNSNGTYATVINTNTLTYSTTLFEKHNLSGLLGTEVLQRTERTSSVTGRLFPSDDFTYITSAGVVDQGSSFIVQNGLLSFFGEFKYDYNDKYFLTLTAREDGSSRFGQGRRFGFFPSASAGWRISGEPFMENFAWVNDLKLRGSYGFTGNERIGDFAFLGTWSATSYNGASGIGPAGLSNPNLQWERTREANIGIDFSMLNGRIGITLDGYSNLTDKLLFTEPYPLTTGFGGIQGNVGKISNKGAELGLNTVNLDGNLKWSTNLNISRNINKVVSLADTLPLYFGYQAAGVSGTSVLLTNRPLGTYWGLKFLGVDPATGDAIYDDVNGDGEITPDDGAVIGNAQPDFIGGITNRFSFKGFELNVFFQFSYGNEIINLSNSSLLNLGENLQVNQVREALKRWRKPGDITSVPKYEFNNTFNNRHSSRFIEDGSYMRLKNLTLGYNLPNNWTSRVKISNARIYASATNLWTLTSYTGGDPEVSTLDGATIGQGIDLFTLPQVRTIMLGVTVGF